MAKATGGGSRWPWAAALAVACALVTGPGAVANPVEESWSYVDESASAGGEGQTQARASIYRGDHLVAVRCHNGDGRQWESLVIGATWFHHPKAHLVFELSVDAGEPLVLEFQRETDYRFSLPNPPAVLIRRMGEGNELAIGGRDFVGGPMVVPLKGSREALAAAFARCGYDPLVE